MVLPTRWRPTSQSCLWSLRFLIRTKQVHSASLTKCSPSFVPVLVTGISWAPQYPLIPALIPQELQSHPQRCPSSFHFPHTSRVTSKTMADDHAMTSWTDQPIERTMWSALVTSPNHFIQQDLRHFSEKKRLCEDLQQAVTAALKHACLTHHILQSLPRQGWCLSPWSNRWGPGTCRTNSHHLISPWKARPPPPPQERTLGRGCSERVLEPPELWRPRGWCWCWAANLTPSFCERKQSWCSSLGGSMFILLKLLSPLVQLKVVRLWNYPH